MVKIHAVVYFIIGVLITGFSIYFNATLGTGGKQPFLLFIYFGVFLILAGAGKWVWDDIQKKREKARETMHHPSPPSSTPAFPQRYTTAGMHHAAHPHIKSAITRSAPVKSKIPSILYCPTCRNALQPHHRFCSQCGARIR